MAGTSTHDIDAPIDDDVPLSKALRTAGLDDDDDVSNAHDDDDDLDIEFVDDTPEEDRDRRPPEGADDFDPDDEEHRAEIEAMIPSARKRIKQITYQREEWRRRAEEKEREQQALINYIQGIKAQNEALARRLNGASTSYYEQSVKRIDAELAQAQADFARAHEEGDSAKLAEVQARISALAADKAVIASRRPTAQPQAPAQPQRPQPPQPPQRPRMDEKTSNWLGKNPWFNQPGYERMTGFAQGLDREAKMKGLQPSGEDYWRYIDTEMKKQFPAHFKRPGDDREPPAPTRGVAGGKRPTATQQSRTKRIVLTESEKRMADRLQVDYKTYAKMREAQDKSEGRIIHD